MSTSADPADTLPPPRPQSSFNLGLAFSEAAALLLAWSLLVINEGALRFNDNADYPKDPEAFAAQGTYRDFSAGRPPMGALFFASLFEVFFGFLGLFLAISGLVFRYYSTAVTKASMFIQSLMGWFVFILYVFVVPAYIARDLNVNPDGLTKLEIAPGLHKFLIVLGMFTSFHFCLALQGGQFVFMARMVTAATGEDFLMQKSGQKMRALFWNANLALAGFWTFLLGSVVNARVGDGVLESGKVFRFPPHVGRVPGLTIFTGLLMLVWGVYGMAVPLLNTAASWIYYLGSAFVYLFTWLNFTIVQFGTIGSRGLGVAMHSGLVFMVCFIGPYFTWCFSRKDDDVKPTDDMA